jgi:DNA-binding transcriptional LysR family regulator
MRPANGLGVNPNALRYFLEVAEAGSFRRAGESLRVAASALNRQISRLEADMGAPLFERSRGRNRLRLTEAGQILIQHARLALNEVDRARYDIAALKGLRAGNVDIGGPETFPREFLPQFLAEFSAAHPRISFRLIISNSVGLMELLQSDTIEIAFCYRPSVPPHVEVIGSIERERYLMVRADHPLASRRWVRLADIVSYPIAMPDHGVGSREMYDRVFARLRAKPRVILTSSSYEMLRSAARVGLGVAIVNDPLLPLQDSRDHDVAFVRIRDSVVKPQSLWCCVRRGRKLSVAALAFVDQVRRCFVAMRRNDR